MRRTKVLFVGAFPPADRQVFGGMVTSCRALLRSSLAERVELDMLDSTQASNPPPGFAVRLMLAVRRLCRYVVRFERNKPDVVLLFVAVGASVVEKGAMAWYARLRAVPAVMFPRGGGLIDACRDSPVTTTWVKLAFGGARAVFCQSAHWRDFAVRVLGFTVEAAPIIKNWTASPELLSIGRSRTPRREGPVRLLFLGWLDREKGIGEMLEATRQLAAGKRFTLNVVGEGNYSAVARDLVRQGGLDATVWFSGWLDAAALRDALAANDVLILPSWVEGLPNAMIESMAAGLAIVVTAVGSIPHVMTDGRDALLVPPKNVDALRDAMARVIDDHLLRERLGAAAFALAEREFGVERAVELMVQQMKHLAGGAAMSTTDQCSNRK